MEAVFLKILNMSITASWTVLAVIVMRFLLKKAPKWIAVLMWGLVGIRLVCPFSLESIFSLIPSAEIVPNNIIYTNTTTIYRERVIVDSVANPAISESLAPNVGAGVNPMQTLIFVASIVWLAGIVVMLLYTAVSYFRIHKKVREAVLLKENIWICDHVDTPFIFGVIYPRIYLSSTMSDLDMKYVIAHEKSHLKRRDHWWKQVGFFLLTIYWFNPVLWIAYILFCRDIELACDEKVICDLGIENKKMYSDTLINCSVLRSAIGAQPVAFGEIGVKERVKSVLNYKKPSFGIVLFALISCIVIALCFLTNPRQERYRLKIVVPAGSQESFVYAEEEISPLKNHILITSGDGLGDTEVFLKTVQVKTEMAYEPTYLTPGMPVKMDVEKGAWFKIGVNMQNPTTEDKIVYVNVENVEVRIASAGIEQNFSDEYVSQTDEETEVQRETSDMESEDVYAELARVVSSIGLENALPWNHTVELKENTDALIKMASDSTGRFEVYGIMSAEYGTYGLLLNDWIDGEENWNFAYVPWYYSGEPSEQPILEPDGKGKYIFAYVYKHDDVPLWHECVLDCGYDTGHMELKMDAAAL